MEAGAVPISRVGGLTAAQQSFGAHDRARRGPMTDVAAAGAPKFNLPGSRRDRHNPQTRRPGARDRRDADPGGADPAAAADAARPRAGAVDHLLGADPDDGAVHPGAARILRLPDRAADLDHAAAGAQPRLDPADPVARPRRHRRRRPRHRGVRQFRDGRQFRDRRDRVHDPGDRELRGHHQGLGTHRRSRRALPLGRHARQADGDRRRPLGRADQRGGGAPAPPRDRGRIRLLRRHGRRLEIRARRRHRGPAGGVHQHHRRHDHRHRAAGHAVRGSRAHLHAADGRRRPGDAGAGADRLDGGRPAGVQGRRRGRRRQGADHAILRLSQGARHVGGGDDRDGRAAGHSGDPVPAAGRRRRGAGLVRRQEEEAGRGRRDQGGRSRRRRRRRSRSRSRPRSRSTISRSSSATRCCRWSIRPTAPTASPSRSRRCGARSRWRWAS